MINTSPPKSLLSNASWNVLANVWQTGVSFFYTPFLIRYIGADFYGLFILLMSISGLLGIMNLGLADATLRYVAYYYGRNDLAGINRVVGATLFVYSVIGTTTALLMFAASPWIVKFIAMPENEYVLGTRLLQLTAISFGLSFVARAIGTIPSALQRYDITTKLTIAQSVFQLAGTVIILLLGYGIYEIVLWSVITTFFYQIISYFVSKYLISQLRIWPSFSKEGIREVFSYGVFSFLSQILNIIWGQADRILLGTLISASSVAYLTVPQNIAFRGSYAINNAGAVLFPRFSAAAERKHNREDIRTLFLDSTWFLLCATIILFVPMTVLFPDFLRLWINPEFASQSAWVGQIIAGSCIVRGAFVSFDSLFKGLGKPQYLTLLHLSTGLTSLVANLILIPIFGLRGAGYSYCLTPFLGFVTVILAWEKVLLVHNMRPLLRAIGLPISLGFSLLIIFFAIRSHFNEPGWPGLFLLGAAFASTTFLSLLGMEQLLGGKQSRASIAYRYFNNLTARAGVKIFKHKHYEGMKDV